MQVPARPLRRASAIITSFIRARKERASYWRQTAVLYIMALAPFLTLGPVATVVTDRATAIAQHLAFHLAPGQRLLEIGAGKGLVARALQQTAQVEIKLVDVVDYNETELELEVYDGVRLPFRDESFDYSLLIFVLHHTPDPSIVLKEALRVSRRGVLVVENHVEGRLRRPLTRTIDSIPHFQHGVPICYHTRTASEWAHYFEQLPVRVELLARFQIGFFWQNLILRLEKPGRATSKPR